jgi:hypothetical protein
VAFTEFTCRAGGSNLNAGTLDGAAEAATAPLKTYTNGGWNSGTGVYTPAAGNPVTDGVVVGQFVSVYTDGAAAPTGFVARVTAVSATTITLSTTAKSGTAPTTAGTGITAVVGGAWVGPVGTSAFPFTFLTSALVNVAGNLSRINLKSDQQYNVTGAAGNVAGSVNYTVEGYANTFGDGGFATIDGGATGTIYQWLSFGATGTVWRYIVFQNNGNAGSNTAFIGGGSALFYRCWFKNFRASFWETGSALGVGGIFVECEGSGCNQSNSNPNAQGAGPIASNSSGGNVVIRCHLHDNNAGSNCFAIAGGGGGCVVRDSIIRNNTRGISYAGTVTIIERNTLFNNSSHGISLGSNTTAYVRDNTLVNNGGFGISGTNGFFQNNAFFGNTSGQYSSATTGLREGTITLTDDPFVNSAGGDFRLNSVAGAGAACRGAGIGTFLVNGVVTVIALPDVGAAQHADPTQPAIGDVRSGTSYKDGTLVGTHTDPAVFNVLSGVQWGAGGTEFTGTFSATTNPPTAPSLIVSDNGDGTGATATVSGSDGGTTNKLYYADPSATGLVTYAFIAQRVGNGTLPLPVPAGRWIFQVLSYAASGVYSVGASYETAISGLPAAGVVDNGDGTGIQVTTTDPDATAIHTVEIQDATIGAWRDGPNRTGPGTINVASGEGTDNVVPGRTYWVRVRNLDSGNTTWTAQTLITPTVGYASDIYTLILAAKQKLIAHPIPRIGGRVYECLDPFSSLAAKPDLPAVFIWQPGSETVNPSASDGGGGPTFKARTGLNVPIEIVIADVFDSNDSTNLQWWLAARQWVFDLFNRQPTQDSDNPKTPHGRRWQVVPGPITPADPSKYEYRTCTMVLNTNIERAIGG